ncbi:MAG TPA: cysteine desulfurase family protein [Candidatus Saccharimonadales bacterium]|nr:cysteine desulfurase family protein [Candidatus Saccharimonadales bacterium]
MNRVYLDYNATTPVAPAVLDAMLPYLRENFGNASSIHTFGQKTRSAVETARELVAALIGAKPSEIVFTSGGTESDNHAIFGAISELLVAPALLPGPPSEATFHSQHEMQNRTARSGCAAKTESASSAPHVITTVIEHEAVLNACQELERQGASVTYLPVEADGRISLDDLRAAIRSETKLITVMHTNNELGTVQNLTAIGEMVADTDVYFHTDAVQSAGKLPIDVNSLHVDLLSLSAHKLYGPKGVGALYIREKTKLRQFLFGGHHQRGLRPGTENVAGIVGLGKAAELASQLWQQDAQRIAALRDKLEQGLLAKVPQVRVNGVPSASASAKVPRAPNTSNLLFPGVEGEALLISLDLKGIACSTGAACSSGAVEPSHVLTAIGLSAEEARASLRFSLGRPTTEAEITRALEIIPAAVANLRALSPTYRKEAATR